MRTKLLVVVIFTSIMLVAFVGLMLFMVKENGECIDNPFGYSAKALNKSGGNYICSCRSLDPQLLDFSFNESGISIINPDEIDLSDLILSEGGNKYGR